MGTGWARHRRSLSYIRLAAFFAAQPSGLERLELSVAAVESIVGESLPPAARYPSWWRNDAGKAHARAWLTAGWRLAEADLRQGRLSFERGGRDETRGGKRG